MAKRTIDELKAALKMLIGEERADDDYITFLEDIEDSYSPGVDTSELEQRIAQLEAANREIDEKWRAKYIARFYDQSDDDERDERDERDEIRERKGDEEITFDDLFEERKENK